MPTNKPIRKAGRSIPKGTGRRLMSYVTKYYFGFFLLVLFCILVSSFASVAGSYFSGTMLIDRFLTPSLAESDPVDALYHQPHVLFPNSSFQAGFYETVLVMALVFLLGILASYFYNFLMAYIAQGIQKKIRDRLFDHMQDLPVSFFDTHTHGDIMSIYTNDVDALREMFARSLPMVVQSLVSMVACLVMMLMTDLYLTLIVLAFAFLILLLTRYFARHSGANFIRQQQELGSTNGYIQEMISGQKVIKVFNHEKANVEGFQKHNDALYEDSVKANRYANILMPVVNQLGNLQYAVVALVGGLFVLYHVTSYSLTGIHVFGLNAVGIIVSFLLYSKAFVQPIGQAANQLNSVTMALAGAGRIFALMDEKAEKDDGYVELVNAKEGVNGEPVEVKEKTGRWAWKHPHADGSTTYAWLKGKINLYDVDFGYTKDKIVLHDISIYAEPGQKVAFVGPTGAGKTTITNLLNRFYDIADGKIRFDDININKIRKSDLRRSIGMVFQDTKLFTGTILENIRYGNLDATDEEVKAAARLANADHFIERLPKGYDTVLENAGASLSQGQRQLLAIARAAVANPPVLILDEATSSIDSRTEALVQKGMDAIMKGRTVFVIAHRLSTIKNSDVIMVLDHGRIIERGNHEELLAKKGKYYQLYTGNQITASE